MDKFLRTKVTGSNERSLNESDGIDVESIELDGEEDDGAARRILRQTEIDDYFSRARARTMTKDIESTDEQSNGANIASPAGSTQSDISLHEVEISVSVEDVNRRGLSSLPRKPAWFTLSQGQLPLPSPQLCDAKRSFASASLRQLSNVPLKLANANVNTAASSASNRGITCIEFDAMGALVVTGSADGWIRLYDFDTIWAKQLHLRNAAATNSSMVLLELPVVEPIHSLRLPGNSSSCIEAIRWHPTRPDDVIVTVASSPDVYWYDLGLLPDKPTRVLTRVGDTLPLDRGLVSAAGNTDIQFFAMEGASPPVASSASSSAGGSGTPKQAKPAFDSASNKASKDISGQDGRNASTVRRRMIPVVSLNSGASNAGAPLFKPPATPSQQQPPSAVHCVIAGDGLGCVRVWDARAKHALKWTMDSQAALQAYAKDAGKGSGIESIASRVGSGSNYRLPLRQDYSGAKSRFAIRSLIQCPMHEGVIFAASAAGTVVGWDTRKLSRGDMFNSRPSPLLVTAWDAHVALSNAAVGSDLLQRLIAGASSGSNSGSAAAAAVMHSWPLSSQSTGSGQSGCVLQHALLDPICPRLVTCVFSNGWASVHDLADGSVVRVHRPAYDHAHETLLLPAPQPGGTPPTCTVDVLRARSAAFLPGANGVLVVPQRRSRPAPSVYAAAAASAAAVNSRTHFRGGEGEVVGAVPPPIAAPTISFLDLSLGGALRHKAVGEGGKAKAASTSSSSSTSSASSGKIPLSALGADSNSSGDTPLPPSVTREGYAAIIDCTGWVTSEVAVVAVHPRLRDQVMMGTRDGELLLFATPAG